MDRLNSDYLNRTGGLRRISFFCYKLLFSLILLFATLNISAQRDHPHLLVNDSDKDLILQKIDNHPWAKTLYNNMLKQINPYVARHRMDPEWILSRYLMHRAEGRRYTHAYSDGQGTMLIDYSGDAPVPTVRWSTHKRAPITESGKSYVRPSIEELIPYDESMYLSCLNTETNKKELIDPQSYIHTINGEINDLALTSAVIYWLNGDERYAKFAADILDQWVKGAWYQEPIVGPCRTGFLAIQTLNDRSYEPLIHVYDFVYPYLIDKGYELSYYQDVFEKLASTLAFRGYYTNNWYTAVASTLVSASLSLEDNEKRDYYLQFFLDKDTIKGSCGNLGLQSTVDMHLTHDGHWKEPGGYHNFPISGLIRGAWIAEKNGYDIFRRFPELFDATHVLLKYSFPNLRHSGFGDSGYTATDPDLLEIGIAIAAKYNLPELSEMMSAMKLLTTNRNTHLSKSGIFGLLTYLPELPSDNSTPYSWPRSGELDYARYYLQRNGMDKETGLMYGIQGASYNHNHCNGMSMELYGCGEVMGLDPGTGPNYEHPLHQQYYSQWAAHNTVVAGGSSSSVPFSGGAGKKNIGAVELATMEPMPDQEAISPLYSFTDTRYVDISTNTNQARTMALLRTSETSGYYVDIYRSNNYLSNDYVYHNLGSEVIFMDYSRKPLDLNQVTTYPLTGADAPGLRYFSQVEKLDGYNDNLICQFTVKSGTSYLQVLIPGAGKRTYFRAFSPYKTSSKLPLFTIRKEEEAWNDPFISVYEPFYSKNGYTVQSVEQISELCDAYNTAIRVKNRDNSEQIILQGLNPKRTISNSTITFSGHFGVIYLMDGEVKRIYLGEGSFISYNDIALRSVKDITSAEVEILDDGDYNLSYNDPVILRYNPTSLVETKDRHQISISPNPFDNQITIDGLQPGNQIRIYSIKGDIVLNITAKEVKEIINPGNSFSKVLIAEISDGGKIIGRYKIIKR